MKLTRERYIPQGAMKIADKQSDAVGLHLHQRQAAAPCARVLFGKQPSQWWDLLFRNHQIVSVP